MSDTAENIQQSIDNTQATAVENAVSSPAVTNETNLLNLIAEDLRVEPCLKDFKDLNSLAKSYINAQKLIGSSIRIPSEDASPEAREDFYKKLENIDGVLVKPKGTDADALNKFYSKLGRPESASGYQLDNLISEEVLAKAPSAKEDLEAFKNIAFELGLSNEQAAKVIENRLSALKGIDEKLTATREAGIAELKAKWGAEYDNRLAAAKQVAKIYSEKYPDAMHDLINSPTGNNPAFINMLAELGSSFKEKGHEGMASTSFGMTSEQALSKISELRADRGFHDALYNRMHPGHDDAIKKLHHLTNIVGGE